MVQYDLTLTKWFWRRMAVAHKEEDALMCVCLMVGVGDKLKQHVRECFDVCMDGHASLQNRTSQIGYTVRKFFSIAMVMHLKGQSSSNQQSCTAAHAINLLLDIVLRNYSSCKFCRLSLHSASAHFPCSASTTTSPTCRPADWLEVFLPIIPQYLYASVFCQEWWGQNSILCLT